MIRFIQILFVLFLFLANNSNATSIDVKLDELDSIAIKNNWSSLSYGDLIVKVGKYFKQVPYVAGTLESDSPEKCIVFLDKMDCVTFFETTMAISYLIKSKTSLNMENVRKRIIKTRYRNGEVNGYTSRLHYTSDWIAENIKAKHIKDISKLNGGEPINFNLNFMSNNPGYYDKLNNNESNISKMEKIEENVSKEKFYYIARNKVNKINNIQNGDIVAFVSKVEGLDYDHVGLISMENNVPHLLHASIAKDKVVLDKPLDEYIKKIEKFKGITILRPIYNK